MEEYTMMKDTLLSMLQPFGPSGSEAGIAEVIRSLISDCADEISTDAMGNLYALRRGQEGGKRILFTAHMDSIGYIVCDATKEGFLRVGTVGGINPAQAAGRHLIFANGVQGVISAEPAEKIDVTRLFVDIGTFSREEALEKVPVGTMAAICFQLTEMGDLVAAPYMDDRCACAVLAELLKVLKETKNEVICCFTVQEEVGLRGATTAAYRTQPDYGVAVDVTRTGDTPGATPMAVSVGKGPAVKVKDSSSISTPVVRDGLVNAAKIAGVPFQYEVLLAGGTDAGAIQISRGGVPAGTLSIPCRYIHSPVETVSISDLENAVTLLKSFAENMN